MSGLARDIAARLVQAALVALVVGAASFAMMQALPGDVAFRIAAGRYGYDLMDVASAEAVRLELGLDRPLAVQLGAWLADLARLDLGGSLVSGGSIAGEIAHQLGHSLQLALGAVVVSVVVAVPVGDVAGLYPGSFVGRLSLGVSVILRAVPSFALGVVLMLVLAVQLRLLPVAGHGAFGYLVLPAVTLGLGLAAVSNRVIRVNRAGFPGGGWRRRRRDDRDRLPRSKQRPICPGEPGCDGGGDAKAGCECDPYPNSLRRSAVRPGAACQSGP